MKLRRLEFKEWLPDFRNVESPGFPTAVDIWPGPQGYLPAIQPGTQTQITAATSTLPLGAGAAYQSTGSKFMFVGLQDSIHRISATATVTDVSGTSYTTGTPGSGARWEFVQWGDDMIATNWVDPIQRIQDVSATAFTTLSAATATPQCKTITAAKNFLIAGYTFDSTDGTSPQRVQWSALNDPTDWAVSAVTQADSEDLLGPGGPVQRVFGGEYAIVFQEKSISRMTYVGTPEIWQFDEVVTNKGLYAPGAAAQKDNLIFYLSQDGFEVLINGTESKPIGENKVNRYFWRNVDDAKKENIRAIADPSSKRVFWYFPLTTSDLRNDRALVYDYGLDKWGICTHLGDGFGAAYANDFYGEGVAEVKWNAGGLSRTRLDYRDLVSVSSMNFAEMETSWFQIEPGTCSMTKSLKLGYVQPSSGGNPKNQVQVARLLKTVFATQGGSPIDGGTSAESPQNRYDIRSNGYFHKVLIKWAANLNSKWEGAELAYVDVEYSPTHKR